MYPHERSLVTQYQGVPFAIIGVNSDKNRDAIRAIVKEKKLTWRSFWNGPKGTQGPISKKWDIQGWPMTYLIDAKGVIRHREINGKALDKSIEELVAEIRN